MAGSGDRKVFRPSRWRFLAVHLAIDAVGALVGVAIGILILGEPFGYDVALILAGALGALLFLGRAVMDVLWASMVEKDHVIVISDGRVWGPEYFGKFYPWVKQRRTSFLLESVDKVRSPTLGLLGILLWRHTIWSTKRGRIWLSLGFSRGQINAILRECGCFLT
jgi:hypothetical protein